MIACDGCNKRGIEWVKLGTLDLAWCGQEDCLTKILLQAKDRSLPLGKSVRIHISQLEDQPYGQGGKV